MWRRSHCIILLLWLSAQTAIAADPAEQNVFKAAVKELNDGFYEAAEKDFKDFTLKYTNSVHLPEAILGQAEAQIKRTNFTGAINLLATNTAAAGSWADQFLFWQGLAYSGQGDHQRAADTFAKLAKDFPNSTRRLEAAVREAGSRARLSDWRAVMALLQQTNGVFQSALRTNNAATNEFLFHGQLLLGESFLAQQDYATAEATLQPLSSRLLPNQEAWRWNHLLGRIRLAQNRPEDALRNATNMFSLANEAGDRDRRADSVAFQAGILERLNRNEDAVAAYSQNTLEGTPAEQQRQALLKITELRLLQDRLPDAIEMLRKFLQHPAEPAAEVAWLTLGELQLRQYATAWQTNRAITPGSNLLPQAEGALQSLITNFPQGQFIGKAQFDLGWCFWLERKMPDSEKAFQIATAKLPVSIDQATAFFKLGDAQFQQKNFTNALGNYKTVIDKFPALPQVKTNLFEPALYAIVRTALASQDIASASNALSMLLTAFPKGFQTEHAFLLAGIQITDQGNPEAARKILTDFITAAPDSKLLPEARLAIARSFEQQEMWTDVAAQYDFWLATYTNHEKVPAALYYAARANFLANRDTNAFALYTNLLGRFPSSEFAPLAQWCVSIDYFNRGDYPNAETGFQLVFKKWPGSELAYQAQLMAARVAFARRSWKDTIPYLTNLISDVQHCPADVRLEAMFAYGDTLVSQESTDKPADYLAAINVFGELSKLPATNRLTGLAWGALANCYLQLAQSSRQYDVLTNATTAFHTVMQSARADATARSIAGVGLGVVFEAEAEHKSAPGEQMPLLTAALTNYLHVFYGRDLRENEKPDMFWTKKAGVEAGRLAERLQEWNQAINVYQRLKELWPPMIDFLEPRIRRAQEHLPRSGGADPRKTSPAI